MEDELGNIYSLYQSASPIADLKGEKAITEDIDLTDATEDAVNSLRIAFACDESVKTGEMIRLT